MRPLTPFASAIGSVDKLRKSMQNHLFTCSLLRSRTLHQVSERKRTDQTRFGFVPQRSRNQTLSDP